MTTNCTGRRLTTTCELVGPDSPPFGSTTPQHTTSEISISTPLRRLETSTAWPDFTLSPIKSSQECSDSDVEDQTIVLKPKPITEDSSNKAIVIAPKLSRRQAKNRNRKRNRQIANLNAALNNQIDVRQDQHLEHRIKQLENRAKRQFKEALVKASKAATIASIAIPVLKDKVTDTTELHQQLDNIYGRKESRKLLGKSTATAGLALRYKNALKVRNSDRSSSPVTPVPTYEAEAYKHRLYFI